MAKRQKPSVWPPRWAAGVAAAAGLTIGVIGVVRVFSATPKPAFHVEEATIADIQAALKAHQITTVDLVNLYLARIKAYNGTCVKQPEGLLGPITPIAHAGQLNALGTLNLRPATRKALGFDDHHARSLTDLHDDNPELPDALEVAAAQDRQFARTGQLVGPLQGVVVSIKDWYDTADMRTSAGNDIAFANDRPPHDATNVKRLREAGAIILAKANVGSTQPRSPFGGVVCNPYDTERTPGVSSAGGGASVSANLVTCSIGEETGTSIRIPARSTNVVGISPTQELVSRDGMIGAGINTRVGPICRTVEDAARVLTVIAGYDPKDPLTVFSVGRTPTQPYQTFAHGQRLDDVRIGVVREFMDKGLFTKMDEEAIDIVDRAVGDLHRLGATIVDPGPEGALFQGCINKYAPQALGVLFTRQDPKQFPVDANGKPTADHVSTLVDMEMNPSLVPSDVVTVRSFGPAAAEGESKYMRELYVRQRGDAEIKTGRDMTEKAKPITDPQFRAVSGRGGGGAAGAGAAAGRAGGGGGANADAMDLNMGDRMLQRFAFQQTILQCMSDLHVDALVYPTMNVPPLKIQQPDEPTVNNRAGYHWTVFGQQGFPTITVPAGFTAQVYDRIVDPTSPDGTRLVGPTPAKLPIGVDFAGRPFDEPTLLRIASAYTAATKHRMPPPELAPLQRNGEAMSVRSLQPTWRVKVNPMTNRFRRVVLGLVAACLMATGAGDAALAVGAAKPVTFPIEEATIADIQKAILSRQVTTTDIVNLYLTRIKAYNGTCVNQPQGLLGPITTIPHAGQLNALSTLNLRPASRQAWGFDDHHARSLTDLTDADPAQPDALETAAAQDREFARTGKLVGPLQGVVVSIKDQYDTFDMHTTNGADAAFANDRPPRDSTVVARLRKAGAIIIAKANRGGYQSRTAFGGTVCNPYDTERTPRGSSSGSAVSVSANLVTCAIGEETGTSIRVPSSSSNVVGLSPTQELISRNGMNGPGNNVREGPICRTVEDASRMLAAVVGFDPKDPFTAFSIGREPAQPYPSYARGDRLDGVRIGVVREYMDVRLFTKRDEAVINVVDAAVGELRKTGATVVDPGVGGALFTACFQKYVPQAFGKLFTRQHPELFPVDSTGKPTSDEISKLVEMTANPDMVPLGPSIRDVGPAAAVGDSAYWRALYLHDRHDAAIKTQKDFTAASKPITDPAFSASSPAISTKAPYGMARPGGGRGGNGGGNADEPNQVDLSERMMQRFAFQEVVLSCMADLNLDALVYPTNNIPPEKIQAPEEPDLNGRVQAHWVVLGQNGFPAITVPAGFTTQIYDRVPDANSADGTGTRLIGPVAARLPVGVDFAARPFGEPTLFRIAAAYEKVAKHRDPASEFKGLPATKTQ